MMYKKLPILSLIAFISGFTLMTFELAAARVLAPSIGSSTYVWTSVIGIIIAALSLGYWVGGKLADRRARLVDIAWLCLLTAITVAIVLLAYLPLLAWIVTVIADARLQGVVASLLLFAPTSFIIGMISPYLIKLKITSLATSGQSFASLSALESIGGITGTFMTGFILFGFIGARETFAVVAVLLIGSSWLIEPRRYWQARIAVGIVALVVSGVVVQTSNQRQIDTASAHYSIIDGVQSGQRVRGIATGPNGTQSGIYVDQPDKLLFWYTQQMVRAVASAPSQQRILVLGGGAFTLPQHLARTYPDSTIDVVEIDPELAQIARERFHYQDPSNVRLIFEDARTYINQATARYDIILVDVYSDSSVPFSLMTREYGQQIERIMNSDGVVVVNMIAGLSGACSQLLAALDAPYRAQFPTAVYSMQYPGNVLSNIIVAYSRQPIRWPGAANLAATTVDPYTDNYAPAERLQQSCQNQLLSRR